MIWFYGIYTIIAQTILFRELSVLFQGHEQVVGVLFFCWLLGTGLGSAVFRFLPRYIKMAQKTLPVLFILNNFLLFVFIFLTRFSFSFFQYQAQPDFILLFFVSFLLSFPVSFIVGLAFSGLAVSPRYQGLSQVYYFEAWAALIGGLVFVVVLAGKLDALFLASVFIIISSLFFIFESKVNQRSLKSYGLWFVLSLMLLGGTQKCIHLSHSFQWHKNANLVLAKESKHGKIAVVENEGLNSVYYHGKRISHFPAPRMYEEQALVPALLSPVAESVLVLGYAPADFLNQLSQIASQTLTIVAKDKVLLETLLQHVDPVPRKRQVIVQDPYVWAKHSQEKFDLIYLNMPLPTTIADNRFFSVSFFQTLSFLLNKNGLLSISIPYQENYLNPHALAMMRAISEALGSAFKFISYGPGAQFFFFASHTKIGRLDKIMLQKIKAAPLELDFINQGYLDHYFSLSRLKMFRDKVRGLQEVVAGRLFSLKIYQHNFFLWQRYHMKKTLVLVFVIPIVLLFFLFKRNKEMPKQISPYSVFLFFLGFVALSGEVLILNLFQMLSGDLYYLYGLLVASFMLGLACGSGWAVRVSVYRLKLYSWCVVLWVFSIGCLYVSTGKIILFHFTGITVMVFILNMVGGFFAGYLFNALAKNRERKTEVMDVLTFELYAFDLFGSAFGALITTTVLISFFGFFTTCLILSMVMGVMTRYARP